MIREHGETFMTTNLRDPGCIGVVRVTMTGAVNGRKIVNINSHENVILDKLCLITWLFLLIMFIVSITIFNMD